MLAISGTINYYKKYRHRKCLKFKEDISNVEHYHNHGQTCQRS